MKQHRRLAAWLAAFLIAASLLAVPRRGAAGPPFIDQVPSPGIEGEPDGPPNMPMIESKPIGAWRILVSFQQGRMFFLVAPPMLSNNRQSPPRVQAQRFLPK